MNKPAVVLLSGGLDSATALAVARSEGFAAYCLSFDYGQRHRVELEAAARVAAQLGAREHRVIQLDPSGFRGSALTDGPAVPKGRDLAAMAAEIPVTYVPARNTIFLSFALGWAEVLEASDLFIGVNALDYSGYPDCRPEYIAAFENLARLATKAGVEWRPFHIHTPLIRLSKAEIIRLGAKLGVDFSLTHSCYDPGPPTLPSPSRGEENNDTSLRGLACGACDSCLLRKKGFAEAGVADPTRYV